MLPPSGPRPSLEGLRRAGTAAWSVLGILVLIAIAALLLYQVKVIFPPLVLALVIIYLLDPLVTALERRGMRRWIGTFAIYLLFIGVVVAAISLLYPPLNDQFSDLGRRIPDLKAEATRGIEGVLGRLGPSIQGNIGEIANSVQSELITGAGKLARFGLQALHLVLIFVLAPVLALYLLIDLPRLRRSFVEYLPPRYREEWLSLLGRCGDTVGGFFRGQLLVALIVGLLSAVSLWVIGIPFWLPIGLIVGFFNLIPLVGPFIGGALAIIIGAIDGGLLKAVFAGVAMVAVQQVDNHFISPKILGKALKLHPVTVILALLAGGALAGLWGMLLAVPSIGVAKVLIVHYYSTHVLGRSPEESLRITNAAPLPLEALEAESDDAASV